MVGNGFKNRFEHPTLIFARFCRYREKKIFQVRNLEILSLKSAIMTKKIRGLKFRGLCVFFGVKNEGSRVEG